jgi:hypothetical protein
MGACSYMQSEGPVMLVTSPASFFVGSGLLHRHYRLGVRVRLIISLG